MSSYLIIDGYNLIGKSPALLKAKDKSMELARSELFYLIQAYCGHHELEGIIVYDGGKRRRSVEKGSPTVIYSGRGETADTVIESFVYNLADKSEAAVVTDDRAVANLVIGMGAFVTSTKMFGLEANSTMSSIRSFIEKRPHGVGGDICI
ncbi:MAG: NYN domain-containing protein [Candidatus Omnitrophota bacterium]